MLNEHDGLIVGVRRLNRCRVSGSPVCSTLFRKCPHYARLLSGRGLGGRIAEACYRRLRGDLRETLSESRGNAGRATGASSRSPGRTATLVGGALGSSARAVPDPSRMSTSGRSDLPVACVLT